MVVEESERLGLAFCATPCLKCFVGQRKKHRTASCTESLTGVMEHFWECKHISLIYFSKCTHKWLAHYLSCAGCKSSAILCLRNHRFDKASSASEFTSHCNKHEHITYLGAVLWLSSHWRVTPLRLYSIKDLLTTLSN